MPIVGILTIALDAFCIMHVMRTGRAQQWIYLIVVLPLAGAAAYFLMEILPELRHSKAARQAVTDVQTVIDPERTLRELVDAVDRVPSAGNRTALARELMRRDRHAEAIPLLEANLDGVHKDDKAVLLSLAEARFSAGDHAGARRALDDLREAHPDLASPEGHMIYARSYEAEGRNDEALVEYEALAGYFPGEEARIRHALLLQKLGRVPEARAVFAEVVRRVDKASKIYFRAQRDWYAVAKRNLDG